MFSPHPSEGYRAIDTRTDPSHDNHHNFMVVNPMSHLIIQYLGSSSVVLHDDPWLSKDQVSADNKEVCLSNITVYIGQDSSLKLV